MRRVTQVQFTMSTGLRAAAEQGGTSIQEAVIAAVDSYLSCRLRRPADAIKRVAKEDADLFDRFSR